MTERKPTCVACKGAGGADYTAGTGIVIEDKEISADTSVLATKTELPDMTDYQEKLTAGAGIDITDNVISCEDGTYVKVTDYDWSGLGLIDENYIVTKDFMLVFCNNGAILCTPYKFNKGYGGSASHFTMRWPDFITIREQLSGGSFDPSISLYNLIKSVGSIYSMQVSASNYYGLYKFGFSGNGVVNLTKLIGSQNINFDKQNPFDSHSNGMGIILFVKE